MPFFLFKWCVQARSQDLFIREIFLNKTFTKKEENVWNAIFFIKSRAMRAKHLIWFDAICIYNTFFSKTAYKACGNFTVLDKKCSDINLSVCVFSLSLICTAKWILDFRRYRFFLVPMSNARWTRKRTKWPEEKVSTCIFPRPFYPILIPKPQYMVFGGPPEESNLNFGVGASAAKSWEKSKSFRHESFRIKGIKPPRGGGGHSPPS